MTERRGRPGVSRNERLGDEGLERLRKLLAGGVRVATPVLEQWVLRYGDGARAILREHGIELPGEDDTKG